jgi:uncharacterized RDD family membrane protein YckC
MEYKIIGGDGREYGPVSMIELKAWVRDGRISRNTLLWRGDSQTWLPAHTFSEIEFELRELYEKHPELQQQIFEAVGFWPRLGAFIIDTVVLWVIFSLVWPIVTRTLDVAQPTPTKIANIEEFITMVETFRPFFLLQMAIYLPIQMVYAVILNGHFGATLGKMVIGAQVVRADGSRLGYGFAFLRWLAERISAFICYLGYLFIAIRADKRGLHDLIAGTRVIYRR